MKTPDIKDMCLYNVIFSDHTQKQVVASSFGKAASCAYSIKDDEILAISKISKVDVLF